MFRFDRKSFFDAYHKAFGALDQQEVDGLEFLLGKIESDPKWSHIEEIAYVLATTKHETANTFQPITEYRAKAGTKARRVQDAYWGTGFFGRGFVQLTHKANYARAGKEFGLDLVGNPDLALKPDTAYRVLSTGMREGWFTKKKLSDFINKSEVDYVHARKIVNGLDKAALIAGYAEKFERILRSSQVKDSPATIKDEPAKQQDASVTSVVTEKPETPTVQTVPTNPEVIEVAAPQTSMATKVAAAAGPVGTAAAALGIKIGGIQLSENSIIALCAVFVVSIIVAGFLWNQSQERRWKRQELSVNNLADRGKDNVVATKVSE